MGKKNNKNKKSEFDDFFDKGGSSGGDGWQTGAAAMAMDDDEPGEPAAAKQNATSQPAQETGDQPQAMDTTDEPKRAKQHGIKLGVTGKALKLSGKRGNRTAAQLKRKSKGVEKALAHQERTSIRVNTKTMKKQKKSALKNVY